MEIRELTEQDYEEAIALWRQTPGVAVSEADSREAVTRYLRRNPKLSFVAREGGELVGTVLCGHDGRRGYLHHLAVAPSWRRRGIGRALAECCVRELRALGIRKLHLFVYNTNTAALEFWHGLGWSGRPDITMLTRSIPAVEEES